jgi:hypothetical protein
MKTLIIFLFLSYSVSAGQFTTRSPDGASYDVRTHYFNEAQGRVLVRQEFEGMSDADRCSLVGLKHVDNNPVWKQAQVEWKEELDKRRQLVIKKAQARTTYNKPVRTVYTYYYIVPSYYQWFNYYNNRYYNHRHYYNGGY